MSDQYRPDDRVEELDHVDPARPGQEVDESTGLLPVQPQPRRGRVRRGLRRRIPGCLAALVALAVLVGGFYLVVTRGVAFLDDAFAEPEDYTGPGTGSVVVEVEQGDSLTQMGRELKDQGVVASVQAFTDAARENPDSTGIQVGFYELQEEMPAAEALQVLVNPSNLVKSQVTVPEGKPVSAVLDQLGQDTDFKRQAFQRVIDNQPGSLGLPPYAGGDPEGYLFPATYEINPKDDPTSILRRMVDRWRQAAREAGLEQAADRLGYTPHELMTVASLVEAEGRGDDKAKVARVIYNRLEGEETNGLLQIDATVNYAADNELGAVPTKQDLEIDSPYNTYTSAGLPPGPIEAPGDESIAAATDPAEGDWFYYVTVNLASGETKFAETYDEFLGYKRELQEYCENESEGAC